MTTEEAGMHFDWSSLGAQLDVEGYAVTPTVLSDAQIRTFTALCDAASTTHRVPLAPKDLGRGDLIFAAQGFPSFVAALQTRGYKHLAPVAHVGTHYWTYPIATLPR